MSYIFLHQFIASLHKSCSGSKATRTIPWFLPLGAFPSGGEAIEFTFREQLLLRHQKVRAPNGMESHAMESHGMET